MPATDRLPGTPDAQKGAAAGAVGTVAADVTVGLERAAKAAGDVLTGIFGALPWNLSPDAIANAVPGGESGASEGAGMVAPVAMDLLGVVA